MQKAGVNVFPAVDAEKYVSINSKVFLSNRPQVSVVYLTIIPWDHVGYEVINNQRACSASWL